LSGCLRPTSRRRSDRSGNLSRFENGKQDLGESADKLARAVVMAEVEKEEQKPSGISCSASSDCSQEPTNHRLRFTMAGEKTPPSLDRRYTNYVGGESKWDERD